MKTEFQARPVYLSREDRIQAHFLICYLSLMIYRILDALFKDLVDICKNAIVILSISSVKINRHWQFNDISAYEWYLFHH